VQIEIFFLEKPMLELTAEHAYMADLAAIETPDVSSWISAGLEEMSPAQAQDLRVMALSELSQFALNAQDLERYGRP
jgi:hypothetical protein